MSDLTVFVGTFNRLTTLERCLNNLEAQTYPKKIVIVDNGSTHPAAISLLNILKDGYTVYRFSGIQNAPFFTGDDKAHGGHGMMAVQRNYSEAFRQERAAGNDSHWFAVCDCDTAPDGPAESIAVYRYLAEQLGCAVGPHLSLNVGRNYPLRSAALILNARVLFRERMSFLDEIPYSFDDIDSTFHLFPAADSFNRLGMRTVRVGPPYWTTHTDWLINPYTPTEENYAYILGSGEASRWGGTWISDWFMAWLESPERAFDYVTVLATEIKERNDYFYPGFILSWMLQYGHGCEVNIDWSRAMLHESFPEWSPCWEYEEHWDALLNEDFSCLGWG